MALSLSELLLIFRIFICSLFHSWEFPGRQGIGCNIVSSSDSANFLTFLQTLRGQNGAHSLILSAAVTDTPFVGADGTTPMSDVSQFAQVLDYIGSPLPTFLFSRLRLTHGHTEVMNYDLWGSWSATVGPNAPLNDSCATTQQGSAVSAVKAWTGAGFPASKIILSAASYGRSYHVTSSNAVDASGNIKLYSPFDKSQQPAGDKWDSTASGVDICGNPNTVGGVFDFWGLINGGFLTKNGTAANGIDYTFDNCSKTVGILCIPK
jgi:chitinase